MLRRDVHFASTEFDHDLSLINSRNFGHVLTFSSAARSINNIKIVSKTATGDRNKHITTNADESAVKRGPPMWRKLVQQLLLRTGVDLIRVYKMGEKTFQMLS